MQSKAYTKYLFAVLILALPLLAASQDRPPRNKFSQMYEELPTPNVYRTASGAPGHLYWQQEADYNIAIELDDNDQRIYGEETITYRNNSPDQLDYLWLQLDQNLWSKDSETPRIAENRLDEKMDLDELKTLTPSFDGGFKLQYIRDMSGKDLKYTIVHTMMRIDLPRTLAPKESYSFQIKWWYNINDRLKIGGRSGYEYFPEDGNYLYTIAQFFPRMAVYSDDEGWQHKQFLGRGEYTLPFGDYVVAITAPYDHYIAATGELQNLRDVLTPEQIQKLEEARLARDTPVVIVSEKEARDNEREKAKTKKTWIFKATNVRDFAFASSRKFIWDAMGVEMSNGRVVMAASMYPKEGNPLWGMYSTKVVAHTLKWYSHYTFDYPYPIAWSIHTHRIGMEYPMICFNGGRPERDGTYSEGTKYGMISVIVHEVGHNYFPMIVNSDERQWTWMDEGLNSYLQFLTEQQWERDYPSSRGPAQNIVDYMKGDKARISPIMTNSESIFQFGNNAYGKPATALNILRETIIGRELFDFAFKTYANRWKFKHPSPADFFRTIEDATSVDLDWFWYGWFYTTDHVDIAIDSVKWLKLDSKNPETELAAKRRERDAQPRNISSIRNREQIAETQDEKDQSLRDFYTDYDPLLPSTINKEAYEKYMAGLDDDEKAFLKEEYNFYEITFEDKGGLVMPIIVEFEFEDGAKDLRFIPAEIWRFNQKKVTKVFVTEKPAIQITLDPYLETADVDTSNNYFPQRQQLSRFELFKQQRRQRGEVENPMQKAKRLKEKEGGSN